MSSSDLEKEVWKEVFRSQYGRVVPLDAEFYPGMNRRIRKIGLDEAIEIATEKTKYFRELVSSRRQNG